MILVAGFSPNLIPLPQMILFRGHLAVNHDLILAVVKSKHLPFLLLRPARGPQSFALFATVPLTRWQTPDRSCRRLSIVADGSPQSLNRAPPSAL